LIGVLMIIVGVSLFSVLTSFIATTFVTRRRGAEQADDLAELGKEIADRFSEQRLQTQNDATLLRVELAQLRALLEERAPRFEQASSAMLESVSQERTEGG
jgi:hypothetical protein